MLGWQIRCTGEVLDEPTTNPNPLSHGIADDLFIMMTRRDWIGEQLLMSTEARLRRILDTASG